MQMFSDEQKDLVQHLKATFEKNQELVCADKNIQCLKCQKTFSGSDSFLESLLHMENKHIDILKSNKTVKETTIQTDDSPVMTPIQECVVSNLPNQGPETVKTKVETPVSVRIQPASIVEKRTKKVVPIPERMQRYIGYSRREHPTHPYICKLCEQPRKNIKVCVLHLIKHHGIILKGNPQCTEEVLPTPPKPMPKQTARKRISSGTCKSTTSANTDKCLKTTTTAPTAVPEKPTLIKPSPPLPDSDVTNEEKCNNSEKTLLLNIKEKEENKEKSVVGDSTPTVVQSPKLTQQEPVSWQVIEQAHKRHASSDGLTQLPPSKLPRPIMEPDSGLKGDSKRKGARKSTRPHAVSPAASSVKETNLLNMFQSTSSTKEFVTTFAHVIPTSYKTHLAGQYEPDKVIRSKRTGRKSAPSKNNSR
uniref:uncharacterized protein LOC100186737 isoform X2 n=1 Tax=Ciona intestinalis TaxID=7719 RepID=UPI000521756C|nr:uncharacterized protein LOC100186737 isoform X2 [Ciona intestinalis]|eukprot:XP_009858686.1 uncharacterized protein LOC100186737 isoform X2 [Ciona intestinalis]